MNWRVVVVNWFSSSWSLSSDWYGRILRSLCIASVSSGKVEVELLQTGLVCLLYLWVVLLLLH